MRFFICLILLGLFSTNEANAWEDFYILKPGELIVERAHTQRLSLFSDSSCRERIRQVVCLVDPNSSRGEVRRCQPGSERFAAPIEKIYDVLPDKVQKAFCGLDVILIEDNMEALAYAGIVRKDANSDVVGALIGIRRILVDQNYDATSVLGWKEQKAFGIKAPPFAHMPEGPRVDVRLPQSLSALHYALVHEIGHIMDFSNDANSFECAANETCNFDDPAPGEFKKFVPKGGSWGSLSWKNILEPKDEFRFPLWDKLCFYGCTERLAITDIEPFYSQLAVTNFVTTYAAVSPHEDFAESFTFHVMSLQGEWNYHIETPLAAYPLELKWEHLQEKNSWMRSFYDGNLKYPRPSN